MRRADRLFQIALLLGRGRVVTARALAERLEVSERTIYRDVADLVASGAPIDGEAGIGYLMRQGYTVPPLMFSEEELQALLVGCAFVKTWADAQLGRAADTALARITAVVPEKLRLAAARETVVFPQFHVPPRMVEPIALLRAAIAQRHKVRFDYRRADAVDSVRVVWPLGLFFWGESWTLGGWCELREGFRTFRLDRMDGIGDTEENYPALAGRSLRDYVAAVSE